VLLTGDDVDMVDECDEQPVTAARKHAAATAAG
jgi:hypothetical protein